MGRKALFKTHSYARELNFRLDGQNKVKTNCNRLNLSLYYKLN